MTEIFELRKKGVSIDNISASLGISYDRVKRILTEKSGVFFGSKREPYYTNEMDYFSGNSYIVLKLFRPEFDREKQTIANEFRNHGININETNLDGSPEKKYYPLEKQYRNSNNQHRTIHSFRTL